MTMLLSACCLLLSFEGMPSAQGVDELNPFSKTLEQAQIICAGHVAKVQHTARSTDVVRFVASDILKAKVPGGLEPGGSVTILAPSGMFFEKTKLLVLLRPFRGGPRYECFARITESDADFKAKMRVMRQYLELEDIADPAKRLEALRRLVLRNVAERDDWTRWNALRTLQAIVDKRPSVLRGEDRKQLRKVLKSTPEGDFKRSLAKLVTKLEESKGWP